MSDPQEKRRLERELSSLKRERELTATAQREVAVRRLDGGSRFNIWYDDKRLEQWAPTPDELMFTFAHYVTFDAADDGVRAVTDGRVLDPPPSPGGPLRRGMSQAEVHDAMGAPMRRLESKQGELLAVTDIWERDDVVTEVTFVGGVVVKFSTSSK